MKNKIELVFACVAAFSAGGGVAPAQEPRITEPTDWTGVYVGGFIGMGGIVSDSFSPAQMSTDVYDVANIEEQFGLAGVTFGYDHQINSYLFGLQGQLIFTNSDGDQIVKVDETLGVTAKSFASLTGRIWTQPRG